jgi:hypothetical protein
LNEAGTEVDVHLYQRRIADRLKVVNLTRLDHKNVSGAALEGFAVDGPHPTAFGITPVSVAGGTVKVKDELTIEFDILTASGEKGK